MNICGASWDILLVSLLSTTLLVSTPLTLGALSGLFCERSGVVNIAIEGMMLMGAFCAYIVGVLTGSLWLGLVGAILGAALLAALHALLAITYKVDQIISGTVVNILAFGITTFFADKFFSRQAPPGGRIDSWSIPLLDKLPLIGDLFKQQPVVWFAVALVPITHFVMFYTKWGLRTRAVGEHPRAADTVGINVYFMRYANVLIGGALAGLGGSYFIVAIAQFSPGMTTGRGFIALAALIFGKWTPLGAWGAALLFGLSQGVQILIQQLHNLPDCGNAPVPGTPFLNQVMDTIFHTILKFPNQFIGMIPYLVTIIVLAGAIGRSTPPAAIGVPYEK